MTEVRDWNKDMDFVKFMKTLAVLPSDKHRYEVEEYWLQQYKELEQTLIQTTASLVNAEAEREDIEAWKEEAAIQAQLYLESEEREKKLREAIERVLLEIHIPYNAEMILRCAYDNIYPLDKEEEAK